MNFKKITLDDIEIIRPYLNASKMEICDYSVGGLFMWRDYFSMEYSIENGVLYSRLYNKQGDCFYNIPLGISLKEGLEVLKKENGGKVLSFCTVPEKITEEFKLIVGNNVGNNVGNIRVVEQFDFADYVYMSNDLKTLAGKKYRGQRNMIHQFLNENDVWSYEDVTDSSVAEIKEFLTFHYKVSDTSSDFEIEEEKKVFEVLDNFDKYGFIGSVLRINGKIAGFSLGERIGNMLFVHIEKADRNIKGAYQMLVNQFAIKYALDDDYINREEDMGDMGLRTSKESYHPAKLLKKYIVEM